MRDAKKRAADEQDEVTEAKGQALDHQGRGLQLYGDDAVPEGPLSGTGSAGTAERAAKITRGQREAKDAPEDA